VIETLRQQIDGHALVLVRHGETTGQSSIRYYGRTDVALSELGRAQMAAVGRSLRHIQFARVFTTPLSRASEGARIIAEGRALEPLVLAEFVEVDFGRFEGLTAEEIKRRMPAEFYHWRRDRLDDNYCYPGGESRKAFNGRVAAGVTRMLELWSQDDGVAGPALLVAHRGVIRAATKLLAGVEPVIELGSIQVLRRVGDGWHPLALDLCASPH
jgi:broad specificity phosphatase PhoE